MKDTGHYMPPNFDPRDELSARLRQSLPMEVQTLAYTFHPDEKAFFPDGSGQDKDRQQGRSSYPGRLTVEESVVLDVTASTTEGKKIFKRQESTCPNRPISFNSDGFGPENKLGIIRDTSIQPFAPKEETLETPLPEV